MLDPLRETVDVAVELWEVDPLREAVVEPENVIVLDAVLDPVEVKDELTLEVCEVDPEFVCVVDKLLLWDDDAVDVCVVLGEVFSQFAKVPLPAPSRASFSMSTSRSQSLE